MNSLMSELFGGIPLWYYWGALTLFAYISVDFYDNKQRSGQSTAEIGAWLGLSMVWICIPLFYAGWIVYKVFRFFGTPLKSPLKDIPTSAIDKSSYLPPLKVVKTFIIPQGEVKLIERAGRSFLKLGKKNFWIPFGVAQSDLTADTVAQIIANQPVVFSTLHGDVELCTGIFRIYLKWGQLKLRIPQNVVPEDVNIDNVLEAIAKYNSKKIPK